MATASIPRRTGRGMESEAGRSRPGRHRQGDCRVVVPPRSVIWLARPVATLLVGEGGNERPLSDARRVHVAGAPSGVPVRFRPSARGVLTRRDRTGRHGLSRTAGEQAWAGYRRHAGSRPQLARPGILSRARAPTRPGRLARTLRGSQAPAPGG